IRHKNGSLTTFYAALRALHRLLGSVNVSLGALCVRDCPLQFGRKHAGCEQREQENNFLHHHLLPKNTAAQDRTWAPKTISLLADVTQVLDPSRVANLTPGPNCQYEAALSSDLISFAAGSGRYNPRSKGRTGESWKTVGTVADAAAFYKDQ